MRKLKAFTLVELLVVVAIIAVLATVVVIGFSGQKEKAALATIKSNLADTVSAANVCTSDGSTVNAPTIVVGGGGGNAICSTTNIVNGNWPTVTSTDSTFFYHRSWAATAPLPACSNATQVCIANVAVPAAGATTVTATTKAGVCPLNGAGGCTWYNM